MAAPDFSAWATKESPYDGAIAQAERRYGLPSGFLRKQLILESGLDPSARSNATGSHATGIAQLQPATAQELGVDPNDANASIDAAARKMSQLHGKFGSWGRALLAYHDGETAVGQGRVSDAAKAYHANFQQVPDFNGAPAEASSVVTPIHDDPFAVVDTAHAQAAPSTGQEDPFATVDAAHTQSSAPPPGAAMAAPETPEQAAARRQANYDEMSFPERVGVSAGNAIDELYHGAQGIGAMVGEGIGRATGINALTQAAQDERQQLAQHEAENAPFNAGLHGPSNWIGQAVPYVATAPLGGAEAAGARAAPWLARAATTVGRNALAGGAIGGVANTPTDAQGNALTLGQEAEARGKNALTGAALSAAFTPVGEALSSGAGRLYRGVANKLTDVFGGSERTAAGHLNSAVPNGMGAPNFSAETKVPGYTATAAEATQDPAVAWLDKAMRGRFDEYRAKAEATDQANNQAIQNVIDNVRGDRNTLSKLYEDRATATTPLYEQAAQEAARAGARVDATPVYATLLNLGKAKQGETSVTDALAKYLKPGSLLEDSGSTGADGKPLYRLTSDIQRLTNVRNQMSTDIGKQFTTDSAGQDMRAAARPLMAVRDVIDDQLAKANPALAQAREKFAEMSGDINRQEYLQRQLPPEKDGKITAGKLSSVLANIAEDQGASGANPAKSIQPDHIRTLQDLHDVLANRENVRNLQPGKDVKDSIGSVVDSISNTGAWNPLMYAQHAGTAGGAAAGAASAFLGLHNVHPGLAVAASMLGTLGGGTLGRVAARSAERSPLAVREAMAEMLLNPSGRPVPNVAPSQYVRTPAGQKASTGMVRGATNALLSNGAANGNAASQPSP